MSRHSKDQDPPPPSVTYVYTEGGAYIAGGVEVQNGDFIGRDHVVGAQPAAPRTAAPRPATLLVWAELPFPLAARPPQNVAQHLGRLQGEGRTLPPVVLPRLPNLWVLSLDPTDRLEAALARAGEPFAVVRGREDPPPAGGAALLKLGGDLATRRGVWLSWEDVRAAPADPDKAYLLAEAGRAARGGTVLVAVPSPDESVFRVWRELLAPALGGAACYHVAGPGTFSLCARLT